MSDHDQSGFQAFFIEKLRAGDNDAWVLFYEKYQQRVQAYIAKRISWPVSRKDDEDMWQSLVESLRRRLEAERDQLVIERMTAFVVGMAKNKCYAEHRRQYAQRRRPEREVADEAAVDRVEQSGPTPSQIAMAREEYDRFMARLDELDCQILELELQGFSTKEIAKQVDRSQRTVQLRLERIDYLFALGDDDKQSSPRE